jgi:prophage regulatory protein
MQSQSVSPETRFIRLPEVINRTSLSRSTILRAVARGEFPKPVALSPHTRAWDEREVAAWMNGQLAARDRA